MPDCQVCNDNGRPGGCKKCQKDSGKIGNEADYGRKRKAPSDTTDDNNREEVDKKKDKKKKR